MIFKLSALKQTLSPITVFNACGISKRCIHMLFMMYIGPVMWHIILPPLPHLG